MSDSFLEWGKQLQKHPPSMGLIFGSGMHGWHGDWKKFGQTNQEPFSGQSTQLLPGHQGTMTLGGHGERKFLVCHGRVHAYEGYKKDQICTTITKLWSLGIRKLLLFNETGSLDCRLLPGEIVLATHIWDATGPLWNIMDGLVPWLETGWQARFPEGFMGVRHGRYVMVNGPNYESAAEVRALGRLGAQVVGMSSALEMIEGRALGMEVDLISVVANLGTGLSANPLTHQEVCRTMEASETKIVQVAHQWLKQGCS